jgi:NAD(P)-dependent dehydrogenase (short-subunit alcohol dehydrogenase family)
MNLNLKGKSAVIAGGARGIGRAIAESFAAEGCHIGILDYDPRGETTAEEISDAHAVPCRGLITDVTDESATRTAADTLANAFGRIDHVVFAVAIGSGKFGFPFWNLTPSDWPRVLDTNIMGAVHTAHAFTPFLIQRDSGSLLFIVSIAAQIGSQTDPPYSASKAALVNFMQCAAKDLAPYGIRANALSPGMVKTALNESVWAASQEGLPEDERQDYETWAEEKIRRIAPLGRWQTPEEFGAMAVYLASDNARNITGQTINIDGGQVMHS